jgi:hypothetical protein
MREHPAINEMREVIKMFQSIKGENRIANQLSVKLRMPLGFQGKTVPMNVVVMELMWQQYGLDLLHPQVSRWMEQNAPEVKSLLSSDRNGAGFPVGPKGTIEMQVSLETDDRLREVSSQYILSQVGHSVAPQQELRLAA